MAFLDETGLAELWSLIRAEDGKLADADAVITALANTKAQIASGSYTGAGNTVCGSSNARSLTFPFAPKMVWISSVNGGGTLVFYPLVLTSSYTSNGYQYCSANNQMSYHASGYAKVSGNTLSWYHESSGSLQGNNFGTFYYVAIG